MQLTPRPRTSTYGLTWRVVGALLLMVAVFIAIRAGAAPRWLGLYYFGVGLVSAFTYWSDKRAAVNGEWRVPEATLQLIDFAGGIIGGLMAQVAWRHKTAKPTFGAASAGIAVAHFVSLAALVAIHPFVQT